MSFFREKKEKEVKSSIKSKKGDIFVVKIIAYFSLVEKKNVGFQHPHSAVTLVQLKKKSFLIFICCFVLRKTNSKSEKRGKSEKFKRNMGTVLA